jgi:hypothetical protein
MVDLNLSFSIGHSLTIIGFKYFGLNMLQNPIFSDALSSRHLPPLPVPEQSPAILAKSNYA